MTASATATAVCWHCGDTGNCPWPDCAGCPSPDVPAGTCTACGKPPPYPLGDPLHTITCDTGGCESVYWGHGSWAQAWQQARDEGWAEDGAGCRRCPPCRERKLPHPAYYAPPRATGPLAPLPAAADTMPPQPDGHYIPAPAVQPDEGDPFASWPSDPPVPAGRLWRLVTRIAPRWAAGRTEAA